jgi:hypothetical protein
MDRPPYIDLKFRVIGFRRCALAPCDFAYVAILGAELERGCGILTLLGVFERARGLFFFDFFEAGFCILIVVDISCGVRLSVSCLLLRVGSAKWGVGYVPLLRTLRVALGKW